MPEDKQPQKKEIKVTDKRLFTPEGEIRDEFREEIKPADAPAAAAPPEPRPSAPPPGPSLLDERREPPKSRAAGEERRRSVADKATSPGTPFANFIEGLIAQAYMLLGMLRDPYQPQPRVDPGAARQMIDILVLLQEKTSGNLTPDEEDFMETHLADLKLAFVQRTKTI